LPDYFAQLVASPERARRFTRVLYEVHLPLAEALAECLDMSGAKRMMDLGGGSGVLSLALLRSYPNLTALVVDIANVCAAGREIAAEKAMEARLTFRAADYEQDKLPSGFHLVLECDVGGYSEGVLQKGVGCSGAWGTPGDRGSICHRTGSCSGDSLLSPVGLSRLHG
jgi:hypothetical protein